MDHVATTNRPIAVGIADKHPAVLDYAAREAERASCKVRLVHAYLVPASAMGSVYGLDVPEAYRAAGQEVLDEAVRHLTTTGATAPVESVLTRGFAPNVLEAATRSARMLIIGPDESKPWYIRMFEGRVARHLAGHADCPIVVVPDTWDLPHDDAPIVVMIDGESSAHGPLEFAFETASARGAELRVLHVTSPEQGTHDDQWDAIRRLVEAWYSRHPEVRGSSEVVKGDVREVAVRTAENAAMLILGRPHERRVTGILMDSLAQEIIAEAGCPVAVVPSTYRA